MTNRTKTICLLTVWMTLGFNSTALSQVQIGGLADFELRRGGSDSSPYVNQTPGDNWSLYTPYIRLFIGGNISDDWYVTSVLQSDHYDGEELGTPFFSVLNLNWTPVDNSEFTVTAGRFVTPYGAYSERLLSSENPFVHLPLSHASGLPISKRFGILFDDVDYGEDVVGLTMVYQRMYSQGLMISDRTGETGWLRYSLAATLAAASSHHDYGQHDVPAVTGRVVVQPFVWAELGISFSSGPFMGRDSVNAVVSDDDLASFTQTVLGADLKISYHYYTLLASYNRSNWNAPYFDDTGGIVDDTWSNKAEADHFSGELVIDLPFWPGSWAGVRYEKLISGDLTTYTEPTPAGERTTETWTYDRERVEFVAGWQLQRNLALKASWLLSNDTGPGLDDDVFSLQLSAGF